MLNCSDFSKPFIILYYTLSAQALMSPDEVGEDYATTPSTKIESRLHWLGTELSALVKGLPETMWKQYKYEDPLVRSCKQLSHSPFFKVSQSKILLNGALSDNMNGQTTPVSQK